MGFTRDKYDSTVTIRVSHEDYPDTDFLFTFDKVQPVAATDAEKLYLGLPDKERKEIVNEQGVKVVALMLVAEPEGFDDMARDERPIAERFLEYYRSIESEGLKQEFATICANAWIKYKTSRAPQAQVFLRRPQTHSDSNGISGRTPVEARADVL